MAEKPQGNGLPDGRLRITVLFDPVTQATALEVDERIVNPCFAQHVLEMAASVCEFNHGRAMALQANMQAQQEMQRHILAAQGGADIDRALRGR